MRPFLALGLLALFTFLGYAKAYAFSARAAALSAFTEEVPQLLLRMDYEALPMSRLAAALGARGALLSPLWAAFGENLAQMSAEAAWREALDTRSHYGLTPEDRSLLLGLGEALSAPDVESRRQAAAYILREAERRRDDLRQEQAHKGDLYGTLGLLLGLAVAIFII